MVLLPIHRSIEKFLQVFRRGALVVVVPVLLLLGCFTLRTRRHPTQRQRVERKKSPFDDKKDAVEPPSLVNITQAVQTGLRRYQSLAARLQSEQQPIHFTARDCINASLTCGTACGNLREHSATACYCFRIHRQMVTYLRKESTNEDKLEILFRRVERNSWKSDLFHNLMITYNKLQLAVYDGQFHWEEPLYLLVSVYDYPRMFTNRDIHLPLSYTNNHKNHKNHNHTDHSSNEITTTTTTSRSHRYPRVTSQHPSEGVNVDFFARQAFQAGFPNQENLRPQFLCGPPEHQFPLLGWSVNPKFNFDILIPHSHRGDCYPHVHEQGLTTVPWANKTATVMFRGFGPRREAPECNVDIDDFGHRGRFCGLLVHDPDLQAYARAQNLTLDVFGEPLSPSEQARAKYLVLLDGAVAAFRSTWYLATGSVLLVAAAHEDVRTQFWIPYVHYIPVQPDFSDFRSQLHRVVANDAYAQWVGNNARQLSRQLSLDSEGVNDAGFTFDMQYWQTFLQEYRKTFTFSEDGVDLSKFTDDRQCRNFEAHHCFATEQFACRDALQRGFGAYRKVDYIPPNMWRKNPAAAPP